MIRESKPQRTLLGYDRNGIAIYTKLKSRKPLKGLNLNKAHQSNKNPYTINKISKKQAVKNRTWKEVELICLERANYTCEAKLEGCMGNQMLSGHHIKFRSHGGENTVENCRICCQVCHDYYHHIHKRE